ncbi:AAA family ATPase [Solimonas variicoloris]|uniref:AAA family ATPase n=1 Tax=Solimonas variicoloris TaxID=254408 RepID=UPI0012B59C1C|nr:AAA family ATPase [Solimonas variicoloris]
MLTLIKAQVWKYKSIEDSTPVEFADAVTVLVGKNESGKTAFLEALYKALPLDSAMRSWCLSGASTSSRPLWPCWVLTS